MDDCLYSFLLSLLFIELIIPSIFLISTKFTVPSDPLTKPQKYNVKKYGLVHFTSFDKALQYKNEGAILFGQDKIELHFDEKYLTWYFYCKHHLSNEYIQRLFVKMKRMQPRTDACIHITQIPEVMYQNLLINNRTKHIIHIGRLTGVMTVYRKQGKNWIRQ